MPIKNMTTEEIDFELGMNLIVSLDVVTLLEKGRSYGDSWKKRGGVGAAMMLARKWDRIEELLKSQNVNYDIFKAIMQDQRPDGIIDDIQDLRRYLILVEHHARKVLGFGADSNAHGDNDPNYEQRV